MGGKKGLAAYFFLVGDIFRHSRCNTYSVKGGRSSSHFIKDNKALLCGVLQNFGDLAHLHHKGRLTRRKVIGGTHTGEYPVGNGYPCAVRRHEAAYLRHKHDKGGLPHKCGFTRHIGSCDYRHSAAVGIKINVIWDIHLPCYHLLNNRVSAALDVKSSVKDDIGLHIAVSHRYLRKGAEHVKSRRRLSSFLHLGEP